MKKKTQNIMKGLGVAMAVGSVIAGRKRNDGLKQQKNKENDAESGQFRFSFC